MTPDQARWALRVASWKEDLGIQPPEALIGLAVDGLVAGLDGAALAELAGLNPRDIRLICDVFAEVVEEQGLEQTDKETTVLHVAREVAFDIVDGSIDPYSGAKEIWQLATLFPEGDRDLGVFIGSASEIEDMPDDREWHEAQIVQAATAFAAQEKRRP
ncbi:MAG: hypothetical protein WA880_16705 [Ornithinimicrobium sp.]